MAHQIAHPTARTSGIPGPSELNYTPGAPGHFTEGDPVTGEPATVVTMDWLNMVQDEIKSVVEGAGLTLANPNDPDNTQLSQAIPILSRWNLPVRAVVNYGNTSPQGDHDASLDRGRVIPCDASLGNLRILLPSAASAGNGFALAVLKTDGRSNQVSITPHGSDNVQGEAQDFTLVSQNQSVLLASDGISGWQIIANTQEDADISALRTDIDLNAAKIAALKATSLSLRDGVAFDLGSMNDADSGSQNVGIKNGIVSNISSFGEFSSYVFTGADYNYVVPSDVSSLRIKMVGAGGGAQNPYASGPIPTNGGAGGFAQADIPVISGETILLSVGGGGGGATTNQGGASGGGFTGVFRGTKSQADALLIAGGGGGGGQGGSGGDGGGSSGLRGYDPDWSGYGGTQLAGGISAAQFGTPGQSGSALQGGHGTFGASSQIIPGGYNGGGDGRAIDLHSGGGGGGYYGGGSGSGGLGSNAGGRDAGGGGGSGYFSPSKTFAQILIAGAEGVPSIDADFSANVGKGGVGSGGAGSNGEILLATAVSGLDMDWITPMETADSDVIRHRVQCVIKVDNLDLNNNLVISATSDQGSTWDQLTAKHIATLDDGRKVIVAEGVDTAGGINVQARIQTNSGIEVEISDFTHRWEN